MEMTEEEERACDNPVLCDLIFHQHSSPKKSANVFVHPNQQPMLLNGINIGSMKQGSPYRHKIEITIKMALQASATSYKMFQMHIASFHNSNNMIIN